jgi:mono/diheme cytochrome c family protein
MLVVLAVALFAFPAFVNEQDNGQRSTAAVARGEYIVQDIAVCWTCHTPRDQQGEPDPQRSLRGGPVPYEPAGSTESWAEIAPRLAGVPPGTDEEFVTLMMTGISRTGSPPRPPMPQFRMTRSDAEAVLAYLKSVTPRNPD